MVEKVMKWKLCIALCLMTSLAQAQTIGDLRPIVGLTYGLTVEEPGLNIGVEYLFLDNFGTAFTYETFFTGDNVTFRSVHLDGRYYFRGGQLQYYGLLGYVRNTTQFPGTERVTKGGLNFGIGTVYRLTFADRFALFAQLRYSTPNESQLAGFGGLTYLLNIK